MSSKIKIYKGAVTAGQTDGTLVSLCATPHRRIFYAQVPEWCLGSFLEVGIWKFKAIIYR